MSGNRVPDAFSSDSNLDERNAIKKLDLPTPRNNGATLNHPPIDQVDSLWLSNLARQQSNARISIGDQSLAELQFQAREEIVRLALDYSRQYGDFANPPTSRHLVLAGHQPELFHPGVWYKNFLLSELGQRFAAAAINLVVDTDICAQPAVLVPQLDVAAPDRISATPNSLTQMARTELVPFDEAGFNIPFEERGIENPPIFASFEKRIANAIAPLVNDPIVQDLWPQVVSAANNIRSENGARLGAAIAAGRHRLEAGVGLKTLELPISSISQTHSFAQFVWSIVSDMERFREIYNDSLTVYRLAYGLRSHSHPAPELERRERWTEIPFWIWQRNGPQRKRAFVQPLDTTFLIGDMDGWQSEINGKFATADIASLSDLGIKLRPRALMTTLYSRLILSDLFIHGIGGGKYDQLTDLIATRFFRLQLPEFYVASATLTLPTAATHETDADITAVEQQLRELTFQPERFIYSASDASARAIMDEKQEWIHKSLPKRQLAERHKRITSANSALQSYVTATRSDLEAKLKALKQQVPINKILGSREFSFCLFPRTLTDELEKMSSDKF